MKEELLQKLRASLISLDIEVAIKFTEKMISMGIPVSDIIDKALLKAMRALSLDFDEGKIFIPQLLVAADGFENIMNIIAKHMNSKEKIYCGKVLVYTVEGDIHDIGKNIVASIFKVNGFEIMDLGRNIPAELVLENAERYNPNLIIGFALMTTTFPALKDFIDLLNENHLRDKYKMIVGGRAVPLSWAKKIGADGYASNVFEAIDLAHKLIKI